MLEEITQSHWSCFSDILEILKPLKDATELLSAEVYPTLNLVVPAYTIIMNHLEKFAGDEENDDDTNSESDSCDLNLDLKISASKAALLKMSKYYNISSEVCTIATILDPRLKLNFYAADERCDAVDPNEILAYFRLYYEKDYYSTLDNSSVAYRQPSIFESVYSNVTEFENQSELDIYISEPVAKNHLNFRVMDYWRLESVRFPNLARMARDYLAIPGTSTASERAFSGGRQLITDFRCRLRGNTITSCMLLKNWIRRWDDMIQPQLDRIS